MTSIIKFQALSGAHNEAPPCYILQVDEFRFLLDCGWNEHFDIHIIKELKRCARYIDAVLLTYPDSLHLGALPYAVGKCGLSCPIYATIPVYKMGQMFMYDLYQSRYNMEDFDLFTLDDVDLAFDKIIQLKYNQAVSLRGKGYGITITPLPAGHMIGGTVWKIVKAGEEDIVYAVDFNHKKERHLNGCELEKITRPSLVITDALNALYKPATRRTRDENLMTSILQTLRNNGNVLIAVDTAGRVLELIHMLDQLWRNKDSGLIAYSLAILNNVSYNVVEFAKSQIEWMSDKLVKSFEGARNNPFQFRHVQLCHSMAELNKVPSPKVVLASSPDMECGFSRDLFLQWADKPENTIIITNRTSPGTLARRLMDQEKIITLEVKKRVRLEGIELDEYHKKEKETKLRLESESVELSSDSDDELMVIKGKHDLLVRPLNKQQGFFKSSRKYFPMFPFHEEKVKYDDYGEFLKEDEFKMINILNEGDDKDAYDTKEEDIPDITEVPTKCINVTRIITVEAQIQFIDFEGRSDGISAEKIICNMKSRRLVLVRGSTESTTSAIDFITRNGEPDVKIYSPQCGEVIDVTSESHIYQVRLTDALASALVFKKGKDNTELAWLDARISSSVRSNRNKLEPSSANENTGATKESTVSDINGATIDFNEDDSEDMYTLEPLPDAEITGHEPTFINELKLFDLMKVLTKDNNIPAEILGGVLYCCNGTVAIRRVEGGKVILEGCLSEEYYKIRELLYQMYSII